MKKSLTIIAVLLLVASCGITKSDDQALNVLIEDALRQENIDALKALLKRDQKEVGQYLSSRYWIASELINTVQCEEKRHRIHNREEPYILEPDSKASLKEAISIRETLDKVMPELSEEFSFDDCYSEITGTAGEINKEALLNSLKSLIS